MYANMEQVLLNAVYGDDFNHEKLEIQLKTLVSNIDKDRKTLKEIIEYLRSLPIVSQKLLSEIIVLAKLILVMPVTNASSERSFISLKQIKTYLRNTMLQPRLNWLRMLHVHKEEADVFELPDIADEFVSKSETSERAREILINQINTNNYLHYKGT